MALRNAISVDSRLMYDHQTQVLVEGCNQVSARSIAATQVSNNLISFDNLLSIGENSVIDPNVFIEYEVEIEGSQTASDVLTPPGCQTTLATPSVWAPAIPATTIATKVDQATLVNNPNFIFAQYPLSGVCNNLSVSINNVNTTINLCNVVAVLRENLLSVEKRNQVATMVPCALNQSPLLYPQYTVLNPYGTNNQPNTSMEDSNQRSRLVVEVSAPITGRTVRYRIREPIFISPFQLSKSAHGLCNVNSLSVRFQLDASTGLRGMFNATQDVLDTNINLTIITIKSANLIINYMSVDVVDHPIPAVAYYDYSAHEINLTTLTTSPVVMDDVQKSQSCNAFKLTTIPKFYWIKVSPNTSALLPKNLLCGFPITQLQVNYGSYGIYVFNRAQLWVAYCRNTQQIDLSYRQWVALGTPVCLSPTLDMSSASSFAGVDGVGGLMFQSTVNYNCTNYLDVGLPTSNANITATNCNVIEMFVMQGSLAIGNGSAVFKNSTINMTTFDELGQHSVAISDSSLAQATGGNDGAGFGWGSVKSLLSSGAKKLGKVAVEQAVKHAPDLAKAGAQYGLGKLQEHLDGSGMGVSAGRYSRRH